jgi:hypothetical protein
VDYFESDLRQVAVGNSGEGFRVRIISVGGDFPFQIFHFSVFIDKHKRLREDRFAALAI